MENSRPGQKIHVASFEELLGAPTGDGTEEIEIAKLVEFRNHPFKVNENDAMQELIESILVNGVLVPILVRPTGMATFEIVSGHRRVYASKKAGLERIPAIVREMTDDEAVIAMVDANIQREELLPSEKAWSTRMKMDAMKRQGERADLTSCQSGAKLRTDAIIAMEMGESARTIQRYIRLTELIPELLKMTDEKKLPFMAAVEISYLDKSVQKYIYEFMNENGPVNQKHIIRLRTEIGNKEINQGELIRLMNAIIGNPRGEKGIPSKVVLRREELSKYFPPEIDISEWEDVIINLLKEWKTQWNGGEKDET